MKDIKDSLFSRGFSNMSNVFEIRLNMGRKIWTQTSFTLQDKTFQESQCQRHKSDKYYFYQITTGLDYFQFSPQ